MTGGDQVSVDPRVRTLIENSVRLKHRGLIYVLGNKAREQVREEQG